ncbi:MAG: tetratricopeptide repeat protein [Candidatus Marinimicrobia bacterium]|nr:tetratricopeptide repeat protein [Candidatus Neomarinimicrobiota bacterium]MBL7011128.1 tetratricopeptide repeat protein [Candidatus Neomarinimicrobiota bacterium]MBL7031510.1 tetratricopeptide repeat protein [Candidatus Neomarinimicrobiota bacterium]
MDKIRIYTSLRPFLLFATILVMSCANFKAYFNSFYNAEEYFKKAEKVRLENRGDILPQSAIKDYKKVIDKSRLVIDTYPEFKLRKKALLLMVQSHYHLGELGQANSTIGEMENEFGEKVYIERAYWTSLIKWKQGKPQPAINGLNDLIQYGLNKDREAKVYLSIAEIYFEQGMELESMDYLEKAADIIQEPNEKGQIYYRIASLSFEDQDYSRAVSAYKQVIKNSQSKKQIQESHLKTVQIYRLKGDMDLAGITIKNMLLNEDYKSIYPSLELELSKLYEMQNMLPESINRLETIVQDYPKTEASAEAFYLLGNYSISQDWNLDAALKQFKSVERENRKSLYRQPALMRIKEIASYTQSKLDFIPWESRIVSSDTMTNFQFTVIEQNELAKILYSLNELESFHFNRSDSGLIYLDLLIQYADQSKLLPKALYAKSIVMEAQDDSITARELKQRIMAEFPKTDYALAIIHVDDTYKPLTTTSDEQLVRAEQQWLSNPTLAIDGYKEIISKDTVSEASAKAAYFLAYQYDYHLIQPDSALKYYDWILKYHIESDQALPSEKRFVFLNKILADTTASNDH